MSDDNEERKGKPGILVVSVPYCAVLCCAVFVRLSIREYYSAEQSYFLYFALALGCWAGDVDLNRIS